MRPNLTPVVLIMIFGIIYFSAWLDWWFITRKVNVK